MAPPIPRTQTELRADLDVIIGHQAQIVADTAATILNIHAIDSSIVYGMILRKPQVFIDFIKVQLAFANIPGPRWAENETAEDDIKDIRRFVHVHLIRANLIDQPRYSWFVLDSDPVMEVLDEFTSAFLDALFTEDAAALALAEDHPAEFRELCQALLTGSRSSAMGPFTDEARQMRSQVLYPHFYAFQGHFAFHVTQHLLRAHERLTLIAPPAPCTEAELQLWNALPNHVQDIAHLAVRANQSHSNPDEPVDIQDLFALATAAWENRGFEDIDRLLTIYGAFRPQSAADMRRVPDATWDAMELDYMYIRAYYMRQQHADAAGFVSTAYENALVFARHYNASNQEQLLPRRWPALPKDELVMLITEAFSSDLVGGQAPIAGPLAQSAGDRKMSTMSSETSDADIRCILCYDMYAELEEEGEVAKTLGCSHIFGSQCLRKTDPKVCPVCRAPYSVEWDQEES